MNQPRFHPSLPAFQRSRTSRLRVFWCLALIALLALAGRAMATDPTMKVGNLVYADFTGNGVYDPGEGVGGVTLELWKFDGDPNNLLLVGTTVSAPNGFYEFTGLDSGTYHVTIPASQFASGGPLEGMFSLPGALGFGEGDDDLGEKGLDTFDPTLTGVSTNDFIVAPGFGPVGSEESGFMGDADDDDDSNGDMTVDFGFYRPLGLGNLVFADTNNNGHADPGEGVSGVEVQLYHDTDTPGIDTPVADLVTDDSGHYLFGGLLPGLYKVFIPASQFAQGGPLEGALSLPGVGNADEDDDQSEDGIDDTHPEINGIFSRTVTLSAGIAPTTATGETGSQFDDDINNDADVDLTIDLGFTLPAGKVGVGNLVFIDANGNGLYDDGEGAAGVTVQLFAAGADPLLDAAVASVQTASDGSYLITNLDPGDYFLFVPPSEFMPGRPLFSALSVPGTFLGDDDDGEDGVDEAQPELHGVHTEVFTLAVGGAPTDADLETGYRASSDNFRDSSVDLTRDFGFVLRASNPLSVGNLVFVDTNHSGRFESGEGVGGVQLGLFLDGDDPSAQLPRAMTTTDTDGSYLFTGLLPGRYFVQVLAVNFQAGQPLAGLLSMAGNGGDDGVDDDHDENGIDSPNPQVTGIVCPVFELAEGTEPVETGFRADMDDALETNGDMTIDFGFTGPCPTLNITPSLFAGGMVGAGYGPVNFGVTGANVDVTWALAGGVMPPGLTLSAAGELSGTPTDVGDYEFTVQAATGDGCTVSAIVGLSIAPAAGNLGVGNAIYFDANGNGVMDAGEGVPGVLVLLFKENDDPLTATPQALTTTSALGAYGFGGLQPGRYFIQVPASQFGSGGPLENRVSAPGVSNDDGVDDNVPGNDNGIDAADPTATGVSSVVFELAEGLLPVDGPDGSETGFSALSDNAADANVNLTIDLAFVRSPQTSVSVGNLVFKDANGNGRHDFGEGAANVTVQLFAPGADPQTDEPLATTLTNASGLYSFTNLEPGSYFIHVPAGNFATGAPLAGLASVPGVGILDDSDDGVDAPDPAATGISSGVFTLALSPDANLNPELNFNPTIDFGFYDASIPLLGVGNLVFFDANQNHQFDSGEGVQGVRVQLFAAGADPLTDNPAGETVTDAQGAYLLTTNVAGDYFVFIPPANFDGSGALYSVVSLPGASTGDGVDDGTDENGIDSANPVVTGIASNVIHLAEGTAPTAATGETGFLSEADDANDANYDLTVDFGFGLSCPTILTAPATLPNGTLGEAYGSTPLQAAGGAAPYTWGVTVGSLPPGVILRGQGTFAGVPTQEGLFSFTVTATDSAGCQGSHNYQVLIGAAPTVGLGNAIYIDVNHNGLMDSGEGVSGVVVELFKDGDDPQTATPLQQMTTSPTGGYAFEGLETGNYFVHVPASEFAIGKPLHGMISIPGVSGDDGVDDNLAGNDNGVDAANPELTGISSIVVGLQPATEPVDGPAGSETGFNADADNAHDANFDSTIDLGFQTPCPTLVINPGALLPATVGYSFSQTLSVTGATSPVAFSITTGGLPDGITLSAGGQISGSTTTKGSFPLTLRATQLDGCFIDWPTSFVVNGQLAVGNLVFFDKNGNGRADEGEGVDGVTVELYHDTDTPESDLPIASATTAGGGFYLIDTLPPGSYVLHLPKTMFASGAPLWKMVSVSGLGTGDDDAGEAGQDAVDPTATGISTAVFTLAAGTAPTAATGETGLHSDTDDTRDADIDLTKDFGLVDASAKPATFTAWGAANNLPGGQSGPNDNADHDAYSNLVEYALGLNPTGGGDSVSGALVINRNGTSGKMDVRLRHRHGGQGDITYVLQVLASLSSTWTASSVTPTVVNNGDGTETVTFGSLDDDPALQGSNYGLVRVQIILDANHDGTPEATDYSPIMGWQRRTLAVQNQTYAVPFVPAAAFTGTPDAVNGSTLDVTTSMGTGDLTTLLTAGRQYYVEVMSGANIGQRWEIDEAACTATSIALLPAADLSTQATVPVSLAGDLVAVRPHWRVADLFPPADYHATNSSSSADQILIWDRNTASYVTLWLANFFGQAHWHQVGVADINATEDSRVIGPCDGLFAKPKVGSVSASGIGQLRTWPLACPLKPGANFIGNPFPVAQSPALRGMNVAGGFTGTNNPATSDRIYFWAGDTSLTNTGYATYQLYKQGSRELWKIVGSTDLVTDYGTQNLFSAGTAAFINSINGKPDWVIPAPVIP